MNKITSLLKLLNKKNIIYGVVGVLVLLALVYFFFIRNGKQQETLVIHPTDFLQQVSVSGKVIATEDLNLSFEQVGIVRGMYAKVGDTVKASKLLINQDTSQLYTQLEEMQAGIDLQKAKLNQLLAGSSPEDIKTATDLVTSAKENLANAYQSALVVLNTSYNAIYNANSVALYTRNTYFLTTGQQSIRVQDAKNNIATAMQNAKDDLDKATVGSNSDIDTALNNMLANLKNTYNYLKIIRDQCDEDVYYSRVSATDKTSLDNQKININTALTNLIVSEQSINSYASALNQAENELRTTTAIPRETDIAVFTAQIKQAEAGLQNILTQIRKKQIFAPIDGIITQVNAKTGSLSGPSDMAVSLISSGKFQIESYVPEIYISLIKVGNEADVMLDAYGEEVIFKAKVISTDPSQTIKDGVSTYKTKLELEDHGKTIKTGMTANVIITTEKKSNVISMPQGILKTEGGKKMVEVLENGKAVKREVTIGDYSSSGQVEIISGLKDGDVVIIP